MEEKEKLTKRVNEVKKNKRIIQEWMVRENNRMREEDILNTAKEEALEEEIEQEKNEIIKKMIKNNVDYQMISDITGKTIEEIKNIEKM